MDKSERVLKILTQIKEQAEELLDSGHVESMTAEEIVTLATEMTTFIPVTTMEYTQPIGIVDRNRATFLLDDEFEFPLFGDEYYEEDV
jgi:hypothetical protein